MGAVAAGRNIKEMVLLAVNAGADILLFGNNMAYDENLAAHVHAALLDLVDEGRISSDRIRASWQRVSALKARLR